MRIIEQLTSPRATRIVAPMLFLFIFFKWIFSTAFGLLIISIVVYFTSDFLFGTKPLTPKELILIIDSSSEERKIAIFTSLITLAGFVIAFWQASLIWKKQKKTEISIQAINEISEFFDECWNIALKIQLHAESTGSLQKAISGEVVELSQAYAESRFLIAKTDEFVACRNKLSSMAIKVHAIRSKHHLILSESWFKLKLFDDCEKSLTKISELMWFFAPLSAENPAHYLVMMTIEDTETASNAARQIEKEIIKGSSHSGAIRASMLGNFFTPSITSIFDFTRMMKTIDEKRNKPIEVDNTRDSKP